MNEKEKVLSLYLSFLVGLQLSVLNADNFLGTCAPQVKWYCGVFFLNFCEIILSYLI